MLLPLQLSIYAESVLDCFLAILFGWQRVPLCCLQPPVPAQLGNKHQVVAGAHEIGQEGVSQDMGRQLKSTVAADLTDDQVYALGGHPLSLWVQEERRGSFLANVFGCTDLEPFVHGCCRLDI